MLPHREILCSVTGMTLRNDLLLICRGGISA